MPRLARLLSLLSVLTITFLPTTTDTTTISLTDTEKPGDSNADIDTFTNTEEGKDIDKSGSRKTFEFDPYYRIWLYGISYTIKNDKSMFSLGNTLS